MSTGKRRTNWVSTDRPRRRRPRLLITGALSGLVTAAIAGGTLVGFGASPALALCSGDGDSCVNTASPASSVEILPISADDAKLTVSNDGAAGTAKVGVVGYLRGDDATQAAVVETAPKTTAAVSVTKGDRRTLRLNGVPKDARAIVLQVGGDDASSARASWRPDPSASTTASASVDLSPNHDQLTRSQIMQAVRSWAARTGSSMPTRALINHLVDRMGAASGTPAHLVAAIAAGKTSLRVGWQLQSGAENVTAVRITRDGESTPGSSPLTTDRAARSGTINLKGLVAGRKYTVTVAPVIDGEVGSPITMLAAPYGAEDGDSTPSASASASASASTKPTASASASASATSKPSSSASQSAAASAPAATGSGSSAIPATPAGWKPLFTQTFDKAAALGDFTKAYPGWSGYDGGTDTSRTAGRAANQTGLWNNASTSSVSNGVYNCHLFTQNGRPQVCALTPSLNGSYWSGQMYGRYSVRFKSDRLPGYKIAWLLWPSSDNWSQGEIDFPEGDLDGTATGSVHNVNGNPSQNAYWVDTKTDMNTWRTATIDWRPGRVTFMLDDQSWTTTDPSGIPKNPMRWALQAETQIAAQPPSASVAGNLQIDWLAGYSYAG